MIPCAIFDIDGTLADASHRLHLLPKGNREKDGITPSWEAFFAAAVDDVPIPAVRELCNIVAHAMPVFLVTGRPEKDRELTQTWLEKHGIRYAALFMRPDGDRRPDTEVKFEEFQRIVDMGYTPAFAVEDRLSVTRMWREKAGIVCLQVCEGNY